MKVIWKYKLSGTGKLEIPKAAEILSVHEQHDDIYIWALVESDNTVEFRHFSVIGTGWEITHDAKKFIGTVHLKSGLVFHVFEK